MNEISRRLQSMQKPKSIPAPSNRTKRRVPKGIVDLRSGIAPWQLINALPAAIYVTDHEGRITYFNEAAAVLWGCRPKLGSDQWCGSWRLYWLDGTPMPHDQCPMAITLRQGSPVRGGMAIAERPDGTRVSFMAFPTPLRDSSGNLIGAVNMLIEISDHQRAERVEHRLAAIVESCDDAILSADVKGVITTWNRAAERLFGYSEAEAIGKPVTILTPPDRQKETERLQRVRLRERIDHFETVRQRKDGSLVDVSLTVSPIPEGGRIVGASGIARDITERKRAEERQGLLLAELDHRVKNVLAQVAVMASSTGQDSHSIDEFLGSLNGRIQSMAAAHTLLSERGWQNVELGALVRNQLAPYATGTNVTISGTDMALNAAETQAVARVLHELATNAAKYGALSTRNGQVSVKWDLRPNGSATNLTLIWCELGGPPVASKHLPSYGTIRNLIPHELGGTVDLVFAMEGVTCKIEVPIELAGAAGPLPLEHLQNMEDLQATRLPELFRIADALGVRREPISKRKPKPM